MAARLESVVDAPVHEQVRALERAVRTNPVIEELLPRAAALDLPDWYLGAGCIAGTVWNLRHDFDPTHGIKDYDLVYFDGTDLSAAAEQEVQRRVGDAFADLALPIDVANEARVHLWYGADFGTEIEPYRSTAHAISTWPSTSTAIGVRRDGAGFTVCAPFGLRDLFGLHVRPNKVQVPERIYTAKAARWHSIWAQLDVEPW